MNLDIPDLNITAKIESICLLNGGLFVEMQRPTLMHKLLNSRMGPMLSRLFTESRFNQAFSKVFGPHTKPSKDELAEFWAQVTCNGGANIGHRLVGYIQEREEYRNRWVQALVPFRMPRRAGWAAPGKAIVSRPAAAPGAAGFAAGCRACPAAPSPRRG